MKDIQDLVTIHYQNSSAGHQRSISDIGYNEA